MATLILRGGVWSARLHVPVARWEDVGRALGAAGGVKREVVRTLQTGSKREAQRRLPEATALIQAEIERALAAARLPPLTDWTANWHERAATIRTDLDKRGLEIAGWEGEPDGSSTPVHKWEAIKASAEFASDVVRHRQGTDAATRFLAAATSEGLSIGTAVRTWLDEQRRRVRPTTIVSHEAAFAKLACYLADHQRIPSLDVAEFPQVSRRMAGEFIEFRKGHNAGATILREFSAYSGLWRWALRRGYAETNPWTDQTAGLKDRDAGAEGEERAFTTAELVSLIRARQDDLAPNRGALAATFWDAMRLGLLTGARLSELVDMSIAAIIEDGTALAVAADPKRRGKTDAAPRIIPLHPLAQRVIRERLASLSDTSPEAPLFPELPPGGANDTRAKTFTTRFVSVRRRVAGESDAVDYHSFRRSWATAAETAMHAGGRVNEALIALLAGHKRGSLAFDLYSDWTRMGRADMTGKLAERLATLRGALEDVVNLGLAREVLTALEETQGDRPAVVRTAPAFRRT